MIALTRIDELAQRLAAALPPGAQQMRTEAEAQFRAVLRKGMASMDLVSRADFDDQKAALERATAKLKVLEQRLAELENSHS